MKRKIFTFVSTLALSAALIISAQAASPTCTTRSRTFCFGQSVCIPCPPSVCQPSSCPSAPNTPTLPDEPETPAQPDAPAGVSVYEQEVVRLVNQERARYGLGALAIRADLCDYARVKSQDMHDSGYFSHTSPNYGTPFEMMKVFGVTYAHAGENIAMGYSTPEAVVSAWMNSESHRANILSASYTEIGVGYVADGGYWTQWFVG